MRQSLILGNVVISAMITKSEEAENAKKINNSANSVKLGVLPRVWGNTYKFVLHALSDTEIYSTTNNKNYTE